MRAAIKKPGREHRPGFFFGETLKRDEIWMNRHRASGCCLRMIFPENRFALFRIMR
ncbi:hypothetical protein N2603_11980 [Bradyrhizobium huanghuaihaiense]|uniref:hypothetical protein n=1 Tax=Bradyrhizobium huanghuaihaiense TaxID=990078 RepID=UPI0021A9D330|nr:hypothetical protein [Bradyrhizobium sp. CB3035]UWU79142.1 hypothetical protein N2603_11980 [Bradyrhizobium sp. CB3035]